MVTSGYGPRRALTVARDDASFDGLAAMAGVAGAWFTDRQARAVIHIGTNGLVYPACLFGAALAGVPLIPLNYRLGTDQLDALIRANPGAVVVHHGERPLSADPDLSIATETFLAHIAMAPSPGPDLERLGAGGDPDRPALCLYTSGTTAAPKAVVLRHRHLMAYILGTVEFGSAGEDQAALVAVPPYHIAGVANLLSNLYAGRRIIYLSQFDPQVWLDVVRTERVTQAMVVPTMLAQVIGALGDAREAGTPSLRALSYGGARMPIPVIKRALELFPDTGFVNSYGLTETSSTIALLGPEDHRLALESSERAVRERLSSVGRLLDGMEMQVRDEGGQALPVGQVGMVFLRGDQIADECDGASLLDAEGWFCSGDRGRVDDAGYVYIEGRADDTIIRGGENIAPAEIEDVLLSHPEVLDAVVIGVADHEWGQRLVAVVVRSPHASVGEIELQDLCRKRLRSSKTPSAVEFRDELPRTATGKILRREVLEQVTIS